MESPGGKELACERVVGKDLFASGLSAWVTRNCCFESQGY